MSGPIAALAPAAGQPGGAVTLFGRRVSYDSLIVAGATLLGIFLVWRLNQSGGVNLGVPANPSLPDASGTSAFTTTDPARVVGGDAGGTIPAPAIGGYFDSTPSPIKQMASASHAASSGPVASQWQGLIGTGSGPNTTGRSSGTQVYGGGSGSSYYGAAATHSGPPATVTPNNAPPAQNAQGKNRNSGGQILQ